MQDINSLTLVCRLAADPDVRTTASGNTVVNLRVAFNKSIKNQDGSWGEQGCFVNCTVFGGQAEACGKVLTKGRQICVQGRLDQRSYEHEGQKRTDVSIIANQVQFLSDGNGPRQQEPAQTTTQSTAPVAAQTTIPDDDDCPF